MNRITKFVPFVVIVGVLSAVLALISWRVNSAEYYTINNLTYERVEPEKEWRSHDFVIFVDEVGRKIKYLCPENIYQSMIYGEKYNVTIINGDFALPSTKVSEVAHR